MQVIAFGPFGKLVTAKTFKRKLAVKFPHPTHIVLNFQDPSEIRKIRLDEEECKHLGAILTRDRVSGQNKPYCNTCERFVEK